MNNARTRGHSRPRCNSPLQRQFCLFHKTTLQELIGNCSCGRPRHTNTDLPVSQTEDSRNFKCSRPQYLRLLKWAKLVSDVVSTKTTSATTCSASDCLRIEVHHYTTISQLNQKAMLMRCNMMYLKSLTQSMALLGPSNYRLTRGGCNYLRESIMTSQSQIMSMLDRLS